MSTCQSTAREFEDENTRTGRNTDARWSVSIQAALSTTDGSYRWHAVVSIDIV